jgi:hypothetical protein
MRVVHDVKPDGSCFYRSVFHLLKHYGFLYALCKHTIGRYVEQEDEFVVAIRCHISGLIREEKDKKHIHKLFEKLREDDTDTYRLILEGMPSWFVRKFPRQPKDEAMFREAIAHAVSRPSSWASEIDIPIFMRLFNRAMKQQVALRIVYAVPRRLERNTLYILNLDELHYNYVVDTRVKQCPASKIRNPDTLRCVKVDGRVGTNVLRVKEE